MSEVKHKRGPKRRDLTGQTFHELTAISYDFESKRWVCICTCGKRPLINSTKLIKGLSKSCGCKKGDLISQRQHRHGHSSSTRHADTVEYACWAAIKTRCSNKKDPAYGNYGGRGIAVCRRWRDSFEAFLDDMGRRPGKGFSIDRINNDGHYSCGKCDECVTNGWSANCRWTTTVNQGRNRRGNLLLEINGESKCLAEWCDLYKMNYGTAQRRLERGWPPSRAVMEPLDPYRGRRRKAA